METGKPKQSFRVGKGERSAGIVVGVPNGGSDIVIFGVFRIMVQPVHLGIARLGDLKILFTSAFNYLIHANTIP